MQPIAKAMAVALSAAALIAASSATAGARKIRTLPPANNGQRQAIAWQVDGFVIRASMPDAMGSEIPPRTRPQLISIGADMHLDARILASGQTK